MMYYITDETGQVCGKFDGEAIDLPDDYEIHEVESLIELSDIEVDNWDNSLLVE